MKEALVPSGLFPFLGGINVHHPANDGPPCKSPVGCNWLTPFYTSAGLFFPARRRFKPLAFLKQLIDQGDSLRRRGRQNTRFNHPQILWITLWREYGKRAVSRSFVRLTIFYTDFILLIYKDIIFF